jgi:hypothetical protein
MCGGYRQLLYQVVTHPPVDVKESKAPTTTKNEREWIISEEKAR